MMSVEAFNEHRDCDLYSLKYRLYDHIIEANRRFGRLCALGSCRYDHFNSHVQEAYTKDLQRRQT